MSRPLPQLFVLTENIFTATFVCFVLFNLQGLVTGRYRKVPAFTIGAKRYIKASI